MKPELADHLADRLARPTVKVAGFGQLSKYVSARCVKTDTPYAESYSYVPVVEGFNFWPK